ncbi:MAG: glycosyltransferase family 1 protein [Planctomycetota bacterium]|nr:MAG: glycosyltransferase family 1 protein [Planctomycetota bacterium]
MTRLRVGFDVSSAVKDHGRGIAAYVRALLAALPQAAPEIDAVLYIRGRRWWRRRSVADLLEQQPRRWLLEPVLRPGRDLDAFHGLGVRLPALARVPRSFTLHDLRGLDAVEHTDPRWARIRSARLRETVHRADAIVCLNEFGRRRLRHHFPAFPGERTAVIPHGLDHARFRPLPAQQVAPVLARHALHRPYVLQLGRLDRHKNPETSLRAFATSAARSSGLLLVFAGGAEPGYQSALEALARQLGVHAHVRWLGAVPRDDVPALYATAAAVLVPSYYEGFGLPVLEAMACGAAGLVSSGTCLEELAGDVWPAADPAQPESFRRALDRLLLDSGRLDRARAGSLARAAAFTWERCARSTADFLAFSARLPAGTRAG